MNKILFVDCETTGFSNSARILALSWILCDMNGVELANEHHLVLPNGWEIDPEGFAAKNGYTTEKNLAEGSPIVEVLIKLDNDSLTADVIVSHNTAFDKRMLELEYLVNNLPFPHRIPWYCTMKFGKEYCMMSGKNGIKNPKLTELYEHLFFKPMESAHNANVDVKACKDCFFEMARLGVIVLLPAAATTANEDSI